jgi:hypothetical protein
MIREIIRRKGNLGSSGREYGVDIATTPVTGCWEAKSRERIPPMDKPIIKT